MMTFRKTGLVITALLVAIIIAVPALATTWNYANDFSSTSNPNGVWSYGRYNWFSRILMDYPMDWTLQLDTAQYTGSFMKWATNGAGNPDGDSGICYKNVSGGTITTTNKVGNCNIPAGSAGIFGNRGSSSYTAKNVRFTAPSAGEYVIHAVFTDQTTGTSETGVGVYQNWIDYTATPLWTDTIDNVNKTSTAFDQTLTLAAGTKLDFCAGGTNSTWTLTGLDITITKAGTPGTLTGVVRSDAAGNPPVAGAVVVDSSGIYTTTTGTDGSYTVPMPSGSISVTASHAQFDSQTLVVSVPDGGTATQNFTLPAWSKFSGTVTSNSQPLQGALITVSGRTETAVSVADGSYTVVVPAGTYDLTASKIGWYPTTHSNLVLNPHGITNTQNFVLPAGVAISGRVTQNNPPSYPAIGGANVYSSDGVYSTVTDSAGNYSIQVLPGSYTMNYSKSGFLPLAYPVNASTNVTQNAVLSVGWDLANDFAINNGNPNGAWSYGYASTTATYAQAMFAAMNGTNGSVDPNTTNWWASVAPSSDWSAAMAAGFNRPVFIRNQGVTPLAMDSTVYWGGPAYVEAAKVVAMPGGYPGKYAIARFTAPAAGFFHVTARFAGATQTDPYTTAKVALICKDAYKFGGPADPKQINGFVGTAANGYADSAGTGTPVYTYAFDADLSMGQSIDAIVLNDVAWDDHGASWGRPGGYVQVDLKIANAGTALTGRVTSSLPGNPPVAGAKVIINGWNTGATYRTQTDVNGYYAMSVRPDTYDIAFQASWCSDSDPNLNVVVPDGVGTTYNFQMTPSGTWNLADDFNGMQNPNGQWSFGSIWSSAYTTSPPSTPPWTYQFTPYTTYGPINSDSDVQGWQGTVPHAESAWLGWIAKNTKYDPVAHRYVPVTLLANAFCQGSWVEGNHMSFGGGDVYNLGAPCIRWTSPDSRIIKINLTVKSQYISGLTSGFDTFSVFRNLVNIAHKNPQGFVGRADSEYADSVGPAPTQSWQTTLAVTTGDTFEFAVGDGGGNLSSPWKGVFGWPQGSFDIDLTVSPGSGAAATSAADIKALPDGDTVFLTVPMQLASATIGAYSFDKAWGNPTPGSDYCFYVQNTDRTQGIKCITDGTVPAYDTTYKITFTGTVETQLGQKVVRIQSINSAVAGVAAKPIGKGSKALAMANNGVLVKVWGKVTQLVANTGSDSSNYQYEYMVINDGGQDIKIPMHVQSTMLASDSTIVDLRIGHFVAITAVAATTSGTDLAVYPRNVADIRDYTATGQ